MENKENLISQAEAELLDDQLVRFRKKFWNGRIGVINPSYSASEILEARKNNLTIVNCSIVKIYADDYSYTEIASFRYTHPNDYYRQRRATSVALSMAGIPLIVRNKPKWFEKKNELLLTRKEWEERYKAELEVESWTK